MVVVGTMKTVGFQPPFPIQTHASYTPSSLRADASQENCRDWRKPASRSASRPISPLSSRPIAAAIALSSGATSKPASPATSGSEVVFEQITGDPSDSASSTGIPKPSNSDGYTNPKQFR